MEKNFRNALEGCLIGCAVGDSIGLPFEGLSRRRIGRWLKHPLSQGLLFGKGMVSDDTDHTVFVAQSLLGADGNADQFRRLLAARLKLWLATLPAGIGFATLRSILLLWIGMPPHRSGVKSAGNGPSMRSAILGCYFSDDAQKRRQFVEASTCITHRDAIALAGAAAVAEIAAKLTSGEWVQRPTLEALEACLRMVSAESAWQDTVSKLLVACANDKPMLIAASYFGSQGVSGYTLHAVPFALAAWHTNFGDFRSTLEAIVVAGGDTDTIGAIAGSLAGISVGHAGIPEEWRRNIVDWPHSVTYLSSLAESLSIPGARKREGFRFGLFARSPVFMLIVLAHGFRRCLPPY